MKEVPACRILPLPVLAAIRLNRRLVSRTSLATLSRVSVILSNHVLCILYPRLEPIHIDADSACATRFRIDPDTSPM